MKVLQPPKNRIKLKEHFSIRRTSPAIKSFRSFPIEFQKIIQINNVNNPHNVYIIAIFRIRC